MAVTARLATAGTTHLRQSSGGKRTDRPWRGSWLQGVASFHIHGAACSVLRRETGWRIPNAAAGGSSRPTSGSNRNSCVPDPSSSPTKRAGRRRSSACRSTGGQIKGVGGGPRVRRGPGFGSYRKRGNSRPVRSAYCRYSSPKRSISSSSSFGRRINSSVRAVVPDAVVNQFATRRFRATANAAPAE